MSGKKELSLDALELVSGGTLAEGWQGSIDNLIQRKIGMGLPLGKMGQTTVDIKKDQLRPLADITDEISLVCGQAEAAKVALYLKDKYGFELPGKIFVMG